MGKMFTLKLDTAKITDYIEKCFQQKLSKTEFFTKNSGTRISISPRSGDRASKRLPFFKYAREWKSRFTFGLNAARNTDYIEKYAKQKLCKIKFPAKNSLGVCFYPPRVELWGDKRLPFFK